ncbi:malate synthase G [Rhodococcus sp. NBC_00297]|uniref:malate synthase G n=1 Tax=Rhodococcus sp. NBC_00297 TaxID=2976005 RepID=UPI002E280F05|nr:malate synthase G [Rhodococcus sp. NBC_00297]
MTNRITVGGLEVATVLHDFVEQEALSGTGLDASEFWTGVESLIKDLKTTNAELLATRDELQDKLDSWHRENPGPGYDKLAYTRYLAEIGYLSDPPSDFQISTSGVDTEIASVAGPQLVVPVLNERFAINAANARWGSLYDALYGTDAISDQPDSGVSGYDENRGAGVVAYARSFLDEIAPLSAGSHAHSTGYTVSQGLLNVRLGDGSSVSLQDPSQLVGYQGAESSPSVILLLHNGLHVEVRIDSTTVIGSKDAAGVSDLVLESALTTIMDFEDSVVAVDADDKVAGYRNWLGLMRGDLTAEIDKNGRTYVRALHPDRIYSSVHGHELTLHGRSLLLVRNVGHLMTSDAIVDSDGDEVPEGILDAVITSLAGMHSLLPSNSMLKNSRTDSIYIVKPKLHGPDEAAFAVETLQRVENILGLKPNTIKLGIMDEERRTSVNLKQVIHVARERLVFINTGFLDRTGDEIHTSMEAGPMVPKGSMKAQEWMQAYENSNVDVGLAAGLSGKAQIGKGMWAMPDLMKDMLDQKIAHPMAGATTAWVPSPTAATLHSLHYHKVDVFARQTEIVQSRHSTFEQILEIPLTPSTAWPDEQIALELDNNSQSILGYVVRWVYFGIGCSKVPDIHDVGLMEDRATLRISSQSIANWLHHGIVTAAQVRQSLERMASVVDRQNSTDPAYRAMAESLEDNIAFQAACELIFSGTSQPNGYTEPVLHRRRREYKAAFHRSGY